MNMAIEHMAEYVYIILTSNTAIPKSLSYWELSELDKEKCREFAKQIYELILMEPR